MIVFSCTLASSSLAVTSSSGSEGAYDPNQLLSFGTTVVSCEKRTRTSVRSVARRAAYVSFSASPSARSLLMSVMKWFRARKSGSWSTSR